MEFPCQTWLWFPRWAANRSSSRCSSSSSQLALSGWSSTNVICTWIPAHPRTPKHTHTQPQTLMYSNVSAFLHISHVEVPAEFESNGMPEWESPQNTHAHTQPSTHTAPRGPTHTQSFWAWKSVAKCHQMFSQNGERKTGNGGTKLFQLQQPKRAEFSWFQCEDFFCWRKINI